MKRMIPILLMMTLLLTGCTSPAPKPVPEANTYRQITMQEAVEMMEKEENYIILDVRTHEEFAAGHIPGAIVIPHDEIEERAESEIPEKDVPVFVYCRSGRRSKIAAEALVSLGYSEVYEFGGIIDWPYEIDE